MTTLASVAAVLRCFSEERTELTVTDVAALLPAPKSTVSRLLRAMRDTGFIESVGETKRYRPGVMLFEAGHIYRHASTLVERADEVVKAVSAQVGHSGYVSVRDGLDVVGLTYHAGSHVLRVATPIGRRLAAFASATGRTLLARLSDEEVRRLYPTLPTPPSPNAPQTVEELLVRLSQVRREGFAESNDEANRGVAAIAVAVGDPETREAVSLCVTFPAATITPGERNAILQGLLAGAKRISAILGDGRNHNTKTN
ncbi:IclR family transcriptional regulator [Microvirga alba]|uniref:IclR family transcriptional regulator n=1 Tax=Microvirga alba TaxID=2791025 RepID=A0A931FS50_9HYPH|nr:IclR family transcriptional regulator [Microvirga alba]MBF9235238.1 IclR family transcriptional regulator [Microvirga alba]